MIECSDNVRSNLVVEDTLQVDSGVGEGSSDFEDDFIFVEGYTCSGQALELKFDVDIFFKAYRIKVVLDLGFDFLLGKEGEIGGIGRGIFQYFEGQFFILGVEFDRLWIDDGFVDEMRAVLHIFVKEGLLFGKEVSGKQILQLDLFKLIDFIFLFPLEGFLEVINVDEGTIHRVIHPDLLFMFKLLCISYMIE